MGEKTFSHIIDSFDIKAETIPLDESERNR
jgi:hypothetical protein